MLFLRRTQTCAARNLAFEEALLNALPEGHPGIFMLWQNDRSVIVGRHQNTVEEVDVDRAGALGIPVVRRASGGGAVYHDMGNLNFSFVCHAPAPGKIDFARFLSPVLESLRSLGVDASLSGRNDIEVGGRKVSGSAQCLRAGKLLHHGTLLWSADFSVLGTLLRPSPDKYRSKGVASVRARVANLKDFAGGADLEALVRSLASSCSDGPCRSVPPAVEEEAGRLYRTRYSTWEWNFAASPPCSESRSMRFPWGAVEVGLDVQRGRIRRCRLYGDFFSLRDLDGLERAFEGRSRNPDLLLPWLLSLPLQEWFCGCDVRELAGFLAGF